MVPDAQMLNLERVDREDVTVTTIRRPRSAIAAAKSGNPKRHKIAVELARAGRHGGATACTFREPTRIGWNVEHQPMGERAREVELLRQIGIRYTNRQAFRSHRHAGPYEPRRDFIFLGEALRNDRSRCNVGRAEHKRLVPFWLCIKRRLGRTQQAATVFLAMFAGFPGQFMRLLALRLAWQRCTRTPSEHRIQNDMAIKGRVKLRRDGAIAENKHSCAEVEKLFNFAGKENDRFALGS